MRLWLGAILVLLSGCKEMQEGATGNVDSTKETASAVTSLHLTETTVDGDLLYELFAPYVTMHDEVRILHDFDLEFWHEDKAYKAHATQGVFDEATHKAQLQGGFVLDDLTQGIQVVGETMHANLGARTLSSDMPLTFTQGAHSLNARTMIANTATGDYEFSGVDASFVPPTP